jgi:Lrp/AsnC family transcriptional regulator, leucine-responsive regulatory protein
MKSKHIERLDMIDWRVIEELQLDGRIPLSTLGRRVGLSQPAVSERVKRLESAGVIDGYAARINFHAIGLDLLAIARVRTTFEKLQACLKVFASMPEILEVHRVTGEDCFILKVLVPRASQLESVIDRLAKYGSVTTSIVLSSMRPMPITHRTTAAK